MILLSKDNTNMVHQTHSNAKESSCTQDFLVILQKFFFYNMTYISTLYALIAYENSTVTLNVGVQNYELSLLFFYLRFSI